MANVVGLGDLNARNSESQVTKTCKWIANILFPEFSWDAVNLKFIGVLVVVYAASLFVNFFVWADYVG